MKKGTKNIWIGASIVGGVTLLGIVVWQFSKGQKTTLELSKSKNTKVNTANSPNTQAVNIPNFNLNNEVQKLQKNLNILGFDAGIVDGIYGNKTKTALNNFAEIKDLSDKVNIWTTEKWVDITNYAINNPIQNGYIDRNGQWNTIATEVNSEQNIWF